MVYIISKEGKPLMPTSRHGKVRRLLKSGLAKVVQRDPFTIQLLYDTTEYTQNVTLGVDAGSKVVGISATTEKEELYASEVILRTDITGLLSERRQYRRTKRNRLRYRKARFSNRVGSKNKGWLALNMAIEALRFQRSVVRCKDCGHRILKTWADICKFSDEWAIDEDGYCHRGVRRNEE